MKQAYYTSTIARFLKEHPETVLGHLAAQHAHDLDQLQRNAWIEQIKLLQTELRDLDDGWIALEFAIPRMGKRVDSIVIFHGIVFVIEFKVGTMQYDAGAIDQVVDYALDLKNFHAGSHARRLAPVTKQIALWRAGWASRFSALGRAPAEVWPPLDNPLISEGAPAIGQPPGRPMASSLYFCECVLFG